MELFYAKNDKNMANISVVDKQLLEDAFGMRSGYVLDFTDASFKRFFEDFKINIEDEKYRANGDSKANRLRTFWNIENNRIVADTIEAMANMVIQKDLGFLTRGPVLPDARQIMENRRVQMNMIKDIASKLREKPSVRPQETNKTDIENNLAISICSEIFDHIQQYLEIGNYFHAVDEAYKIVRQKLEQITDCEKASDVFNLNAENHKFYDILFGNQPKAKTPEADFYRGIGYLHLAIQFLRNEKAHKPAEELDRNLAMHYITLASLSYSLITSTQTQ